MRQFVYWAVFIIAVRRYLLCLALLLSIPVAGIGSNAQNPTSNTISQPVLFKRGGTTSIYVGKQEQQVVYSAIAILQNDVRAVFGANLQLVDNEMTAQIIVTSSEDLRGEWEAFKIDIRNDRLIVSGSDARGKAYGLLEISRMIGVSPWEWWADVTPEKQDVYLLSEVKESRQAPSVQYRGIFLNDEDWALLPWAVKNFGYELIDGILPTDNPRWKGAIGALAYEQIFRLMLRLRANTLWPAMHECTVPFYFVKGNREMADRYGIVIGNSHCEPLARTSASEWDVAGKGDYNFLTNRQGVLNYWSERLKELQGSENIFTIGMRGKHDGLMQGVRTLEEHRNALSQTIPAQQALLEQYIDPQQEMIPQAFITYKEVLDVYDAGLNVPDHVTLVWCDDNYGYIRRLSNENEQLRRGGGGVYYHISYWGRPHDYLWLASSSPALIHTEMKRAYNHNARKLWILNVGDIKPAEYLTEFFMDMAWNIESVNSENCFSHLDRQIEREFGKQHADSIVSVMKEYYRLANLRKPEHTGWSRVEESGYPRGITPITGSEYNPLPDGELQQRIDDYLSLEHRTEAISRRIPGTLKSAFFQLVEYPVRCASLINKKWLYRQLSDHTLRMGDATKAKQYADESLKAYDMIDALTTKYNTIEDGKWAGMMDFQPRDLPVFDRPEFRSLDSLAAETLPAPQPQKPLPTERAYVSALNANHADNLDHPGIEGLGHSFSAVEMQKDEKLDFTFEVPRPGEYFLKIGTVPNHDVDGAGMKIEVLLDNHPVGELDYRVEGRSEAWKQNVLRGQTVSSVTLDLERAGRATVSIKALTGYVILDQVMLMQGETDFYEFPVSR